MGQMENRKVFIVGGGSAGWITAALMNAAMNAGGRRVVDIALIESPDVPRIAVGEATVPTVRQILAACQIDEIDFMKKTDATFKQGIKFNNWLHEKDHSYYHQFSRYNPDALDRYGMDWLRSDRSVAFANTVSVQPALCEKHLSPKLIGPRQLQLPVTYAYHLNALKMADYLRDVAVDNGVTHYLDNMTDVEMAEDGSIKAINTESGARHEADLFIDCTGFASLLSEKHMGVEWEDFSDYLFCDRAVVMQVPYETYYPGFVRSVTESTAQSAGWIWDIPLLNRRGVGHVYASGFISDEQAERELRQYEGMHCKDIPTRIVHFKVGRRRQSWVKNCVSVGLSGGFLEPLESTGLYLIQLAALTLAEHFPYDGEMEKLSSHFNTIMSDRFDEILKFINLHYCMTQRTDSEFWREVQKPERILDDVHEALDYWKIKPPSRGDFQSQFTLFTYQNHELILYGMDFLRDYYAEKYGPDLPKAEVPDFIKQRFMNMAPQLPTHEAWLQKTLGMEQWASSASMWD